jgi:hypothetical protein
MFAYVLKERKFVALDIQGLKLVKTQADVFNE